MGMQRRGTDDSVEKDFMASWDWSQQYFAMLFESWGRNDRALQFMADLRRAGYDRRLRAGQSLNLFMVSRSRRYGLREDQPWVGFFFYANVMNVQERRNVVLKDAAVCLSSEVETVLARLQNHPID
jgi:hypothetical protein